MFGPFQESSETMLFLHSLQRQTATLTDHFLFARHQSKNLHVIIWCGKLCLAKTAATIYPTQNALMAWCDISHIEWWDLCPLTLQLDGSLWLPSSVEYIKSEVPWLPRLGRKNAIHFCLTPGMLVFGNQPPYCQEAQVTQTDHSADRSSWDRSQPPASRATYRYEWECLY